MNLNKLWDQYATGFCGIGIGLFLAIGSLEDPRGIFGFALWFCLMGVGMTLFKGSDAKQKVSEVKDV